MKSKLFQHVWFFWWGESVLGVHCCPWACGKLLLGLSLHCCEQASHYSDFSYCRAWVVGLAGFNG